MNRLTERVDHPDRKKTFFIFNGYFFKSLFLQNNYIYVLFFTAFQTCLSLFVSCCWEQCAPCLLFSRHECLSRVLMYFPMNVYQDSSVISPKSLYVFPQESICISSEPGARSRSLANFQSWQSTCHFLQHSIPFRHHRHRHCHRHNDRNHHFYQFYHCFRCP